MFQLFCMWHLLVQSHKWKHQNNVQNLLKLNNKDTRITSITCSKLTIETLEQGVQYVQS